jgi:hypothetical protein
MPVEARPVAAMTEGLEGAAVSCAFEVAAQPRGGPGGVAHGTSGSAGLIFADTATQTGSKVTK